MTTYSLRLLIVGAIFLSNYVTWTASRHHFRHNASGHRSRHRRQGSGLYLSSSYVIPGGEGDGWGEWGVVSACSRSCGGGVASQKRICLQIGPDGKKQCTGGDTKYYSCQTQDCPEGSPDFRAQQCSEFDNQDFRGYMYKWIPYTKAPNPCELNCMPHGEHFYYRHKATVVDGTRCNDDSFDVCVDGTCQPVGCDMMLGSNAREDKCRVCRGNGSSCHTITGLFNSQDLVKGYNDILLIPEGSTSIVIEETQPSNNYLALRGKNGTYYLNGHYNIDFPRVMIIAGAPWKYERSPLGFPAPDRLRCAGPTNEPIYLSLLLQDENVGIEYEYSVPNTTALPKHEHYNWVHDEFTPCSVACGGGFQTRNVTCRSMDELETVDDVLCDEGLKPVTNQTCNTQACPAQWVEGPWGPCSQRCGKGGVTSRNVTCEKIIANGYSSVVPESECFASLGPKPELFQTCNEDAPCPQWYTGPWKPCNKLCGDGEQTRQVVCYQKKDGRIHVLDDKECTEEKPEHTKPCLLQYCEGVDWVATQWIGCESCLSENRTRHVQCVTKIGTVINDTYCSYHNKPKEQEPCNKDDLPLCAYMWYSSQWSKCSVECGEGVQTRKVFCGLYDGLNVVPADNSKCDKETKYRDSKPCTVPKEKCPAQWYAGPWSKCSKECGTGERSRQTMCLEGQKLSLACKLETVIDSSGICNSKKCIPTTTPVYCEDEEEEYAEVGADFDDEGDSSMEISEEGSGDPLLSVTSSFSKYEGNTSSTTTASDDNETSSTITGSEISPTDADIVLTDDGSGFEPLTTNLSTSETNELDIGTTSSDKRTTLFLMSVEPEDVIIDTKTTTVISSKPDNDNSTVTQTPATDVNATYSTTISSNATTTITQSPSIGLNDTDSKTILSNETELYTSTVTQSPDTDVNVTDSTTILSSEAENDTSTITQSPGIDVNTTDSTTSSQRENDTSTVTQAPNIDGNDTDSTTISLSATRNDTSEITPTTSIDANATYTMTISSSETENSTFTVTESPGTDTDVTELTTIPSNEAENDTSTITQSPSIGINDTDSTTILSNETELYSSTVTQSPGTDINATDLTTIFSSATENDTSAITESLSSDVNATDSTTSIERENDTSTVTEPPNIDMNATYSTTISSNATTTITQSPSIGVNDTDSTTILPNETELYTSTVTQSPDTDINVTDSTTILSSEAGNDTTITQSPGIDVNTTDSTTSSEGENETSTVTQAPNIDVNDTDSTTISLSATGSTRSEITPSTSIDANATYTMTISSSETENRTFTVTESPGIDINATDLTTISSSATENYTSTITESPSTNINATDSTTISSTETENEISTITESSVTWTNDTESSTISSSETENDTSVITQTPSLNVNATDLTTEGQSIVTESSTTVEITSITTVTTEISENETSVSENETRFTTPTGSTEITTTSTEETEANITTIENTESTTLSSESTYVESSTTETSTDVITSTMEGFLTTTESTTEVTSTDVSSSTGVLFSTQYPMCVPRPRRKCATTEFGCCPDRKTPAKGPFDQGCNKEETCEQTKYKCCPDGVTPAQGENGAGCVTTPCGETLFGCCLSDNKTAAEGNDQEGCPKPCVSSQFGCCEDNMTEALGPNKQGCPESADIKSTTTETTESIETTSVTESTIISETSTEISSETSNVSEPVTETSTETRNVSEPVTETSGESSSVSEIGTEITSESSTVEETSTVTAELTTVVEGCAATEFGCCSDNETPAHGPDFEGCCLLTSFGCCKDNRKAAKGPHLEGCECQYTHYGCCPDNVTTSLGPDNKGCGCQYTQHGCCPDRHTEATGPEYEGCPCSTYQFGCCPDGVRVAEGPGQQGCHCRYSKYGCCSDDETPASSQDPSGCSCAATKYGCCLDGTTAAQGPKFLGCADKPENKQAVCTLPTDSGPCHEYSAYWFYDVAYGGCSRFWYGGCEGNGNRFATKEDCEDVCVQPPSKDVCKLPAVKGPCEGDSVRWYYNGTREQCTPFTYGGCLGNANNFDSRDLCQAQCEPEKSTDQCSMPIEQGSCAGNYTRWGFNKEMGKCEQFAWSGCEGNANKFTTEAACLLHCKPPGALQPPDKCTLIADVGSCSNYRERWFYDTRIKRCRQFYYGGCGGNENNFGSEAECESSCSETVTTVAPTQTTPITAPQPQGAPPAPTFDLHREEFCFLEIDPGQCDNYVERWAYDSRTGKCTTFQYGGCGGNTNNFQYEEYCTYYCHPVQDICQLPMVSGPCNDSIMSWFYNAATDSCSQFTYGGCNGNDNRFGNREACESRCKTGTTITSTTVASTTAAFTFSTSTVRAGSRSEDLPAECRIPVTETCVSAGTVWYYDEARYECVAHQNLDSGDQCRHTGVYPSEEACLRKCGAFRDVDACAQSVDPGPCRSFQIKVYFDQAAGECREYYYGGCLGGANRFSTIEECEHLCKPERLLTLSPTTTTQAPPVQVREECITPSSLEPCGGNSTAYYYDSERKVCVESDIGGCQHPNGYRTEEECERTCGRFREINVCAARLDPGVCRASIPKYYWDATTSKCELYAYGGCGGGPNRFSTSDECEEVCGASGPEPQPCKVYEDTCKELRCAHGVQHSYTREGCTTCTCAEPTADCEPARQKCEALICQFGLQRETGPDGCERCTCSDDLCVTASCAPTERCVAAPHPDPTTQETRYSAQCIPDTRTHAPPPDCRAYSGACAALRCEYGVQRTRLPNGCERCACVRPQVDCTPLTSECEQLKCNYNVITTLGDDGCKRCKCSGNPCENEICGDDERCAIVEYKSPVSLENRFYTECRKVNKDGLCPTEEIDSTDECRSECYDDSYCRGPAKCCRQGCSRVCLAPVPATSAAPTPLTTTHAPDIKQPPKFDPRQKTNVTVSVGGKATLRCVFHSNPPPKITWRRGELTIDGDVGRYRLLSDGALEIVSLVRDDSGVYICVADNGLGVAKQKIHLVVSDPVPIPVGIAGDENAVITGELGQPLSIRCHAYGYPPPGVTWYRGQSTVPFDNAVYLARNNILLIRQLSVETLGDYTCHAYSGSGPAASWAVSVKAYRPEGISIEHEYLVPHKTIAEITRIEKPRSTTPRVIRTTTTTTEVPVMRIFNIPVDAHIRPVSGPLSANGELRLTCELGGYPDPEVYWSRDGNRLAPDDRTIISGSGGSESRLIISRLSTSDSGLYACNAYNDYSSDIDTAHITVNQAVSIPLNCTDNPFFANCTLIVLNNYCQHKYYSRFCCKSCVEAGLLNPQDAEFQADQPFRRK